MMRSKAVADIEACIAKMNSVTRLTWVPKLKILVEHEGRKATLENDLVTAKEAEELAEKIKRLLCVIDSSEGVWK